uniref:Uncharacterized protein n=1 Tax=Kalanchoe fedtschenkoi TaxID=63787 RepID=A0A7N0UG90_KALFE
MFNTQWLFEHSALVLPSSTLVCSPEPPPELFPSKLDYKVEADGESKYRGFLIPTAKWEAYEESFGAGKTVGSSCCKF